MLKSCNQAIFGACSFLLCGRLLSCKIVVAGPGPAVTLIEEGDNQDDEADILVVTETMPATASLVGQGAEGQGALVRNILEAEKALQACSLLLSILTVKALR